MAAVDADEIWINSTLGVHQYDGTKWIRHDPGFYIEPMSEALIYVTPDQEIAASGNRDWAYYDGSNWIQKGSLPGRLSAVSNDSIWFSTHSGALQLYDIFAQGGHWLDDNTFRDTHQVTSLMPRGPYDVEVSGAIAASGRETPPVSRPAFTVDYAGEVSDFTPPPAPSLTAVGVDGDASAVSARWSASDPQSTITTYRYAIGRTRSGREIVDWTATTATRLERTGLGFVEGDTYWFSVQAQNSGGLWSPITTRSFVAGQGLKDLFLPMIRTR